MGLFIRELASFKCVAKIEDFLIPTMEKIEFCTIILNILKQIMSSPLS
jgi:hypothetical protein